MKHWMLGIALVCFGSAAFATTPAAPLQSVPNGNTFAFSGLDYYGSSSYFVEASTPTDTAVLLASGSGYFYGADCSSGTLGDFGMLFDSNTASGITINTKGKALTPAVFTGVVAASTTANTYFGAGNFGKYLPPGGAKRFTKGLVGIKHGSSNANCQFEALLDSDIQASPSTH